MDALGEEKYSYPEDFKEGLETPRIPLLLVRKYDSLAHTTSLSDKEKMTSWQKMLVEIEELKEKKRLYQLHQKRLGRAG